MSTPYPIPDAAFDSDAVVIAKKGAGKTVLAKGIVERELDAGDRVVIIDPKGDWWGLKSSPDGLSAAYPVAVFGGRHGDMPFTLETSALIAETLARTNLPAIIDASDYPPSRQPEVLLPFYQRFYQVNRASILFVQDEVHRLAPQTPQGKEANQLRDMIQLMVTMGRQRGFRMLSVCQRTALVDKTLISQSDTLIAMRMMSKSDKKYPIDWAIENAVDHPDFITDMKYRLGQLDQGQAFVGATDADFFECVTVPMNSTFDSSRTPAKGEDPLEPKTLAEVDLSAITDALSTDTEPPDTDAGSIADDKDIERRIAAAEKRGRDAGREAAMADMDAAILAAETRGREQVFAQIADAQERINLALQDIFNSINASPGKGLTEGVSAPKPTQQPGARVQGHREGRLGANVIPPDSARAKAGVSQPDGVTDRRDGHPQTDEDLTRPQIKVLDALAFWAGFGIEEPSRAQVAWASGYKPTSGGFRNLLSSLRTAGHIRYPSDGMVGLLSEHPTQSPTLRDMMYRLSRPQTTILSLLLNGEVMTREALADAADYSPSSGGFRNLLSSLRTLQLIDYPDTGMVAAEPWLVRLT